MPLPHRPQDAPIGVLSELSPPGSARAPGPAPDRAAGASSASACLTAREAAAPKVEAAKAAAPAPAPAPKPAPAAAPLAPSAQRIVAENNLDAGTIAGSGKDGRVTKGDALAALEARANAPAAVAVPTCRPERSRAVANGLKLCSQSQLRRE